MHLHMVLMGTWTSVGTSVVKKLKHTSISHLMEPNLVPPSSDLIVLTSHFTHPSFKG